MGKKKCLPWLYKLTSKKFLDQTTQVNINFTTWHFAFSFHIPCVHTTPPTPTKSSSPFKKHFCLLSSTQSREKRLGCFWKRYSLKLPFLLALVFSQRRWVLVYHTGFSFNTRFRRNFQILVTWNLETFFNPLKKNA